MKRKKATWNLRGLHAGEIKIEKLYAHFFVGVNFLTQGQEAIGWPSLCCPGNPDGVQQVKYRKLKRIKTATPQELQFSILQGGFEPIWFDFHFFDLDPQVKQHFSQEIGWIWGCPWYRGRWRTLASNWGAWDVLWKMPTKWGSYFLWKIFCLKNSGLKMGSNSNL